MAVSPIPEGYSSITPHLMVADSGAAIDWYTKAFNAKELFRMPGPDGKIMHAEIIIGNAIVMLADDCGTQENMKAPSVSGVSSASLLIYTDDCDAAYKLAVDNGAIPAMPPVDMFWGDRYGMLIDPFGHPWSIATHVKDVTPEEMQAAMMAMAG